ncbi:MAG: hypothetical protein NT015_09820 [Alphaproteobacteria bacterium]|nr:hypothetical protein [Alphaproteobacteria bacterium]
MIVRIDRRMFFALAAAVTISSCSRPAATVSFTVEPHALERVRETVRSFAASHNYILVPVMGGDPNGLYYASRLSRFEFYREPQMAPGSFTAIFLDNRTFPQDDIYGRLKDFVAAIRQLEGVFVPEGYE